MNVPPLVCPGPHAEASTAALGQLLRRRSVGSRHLIDPGPGPAALRLMAQAACRAPDHGRLRPCRFKVIQGGARERLADLFAAAARDAGKDAAGAALDADRAIRAPVTVAITARIDAAHPSVPVCEQWAAVGGAVTNFLHAAHLLGFAGKMLSGAKVRQPRLVEAFCAPGEVLVGWLALGTSTRTVETSSEADEPPDLLVDWAGPTDGGDAPRQARSHPQAAPDTD